MSAVLTPSINLLQPNPLAASAAIRGLSFAPSPALMVESPAINQLMHIGIGFQRVERELAPNFFHAIHLLEVAMARRDERAIADAQMSLAMMVEGTPAEQWIQVSQYASLKQQGGIHASWQDTVAPYLGWVFAQPVVSPASFVPKPEHIGVAEDPAWTLVDILEAQLTRVVAMPGNDPITFLIHDGLNDISTAFVERQTAFLDSIRVTLERTPHSARALGPILVEAASDPEVTRENRFIIRSRRIIPNRLHDFDQEAFWIAAWATGPEQAQPALHVLMKKEEFLAEGDIWVPYKEFVKTYLVRQEQLGYNGIYYFEPVDLEDLSNDEEEE